MNDEEKLELVTKLISIVEELGWDIAIPADEDNASAVSGLIMGTTEYLHEILPHLEGRVFQSTEELLAEEGLPTNGKKRLH